MNEFEYKDIDTELRELIKELNYVGSYSFEETNVVAFI